MNKIVENEITIVCLNYARHSKISSKSTQFELFFYTMRWLSIIKNNIDFNNEILLKILFEYYRNNAKFEISCLYDIQITIVCRISDLKP